MPNNMLPASKIWGLSKKMEIELTFFGLDKDKARCVVSVPVISLVQYVVCIYTDS